ncbi:MAG: radical SAM protein [Candidatus Nealsonbacteria bacterium]
MNMDILFINPPWHKQSGNIWKDVSACMPPFGLALLASLAREKGFSVFILDCNAQHIGLDIIKENLPEEHPRFIGITATTVLIENALALAKIVKKKYPKTKIIIGGVHATVHPKEILNHQEIDYVVLGEGEHSFLDLLSNKNPRTIKGIGFKERGQIIINPSQETIVDINIFPSLPYDLLPMDKYYPAMGSYQRKPSFGMITSRGCPGRCTYCKGNLLGDKIRFISAERIVKEIIYLQENYGIRDITFYDDTFTSNKQRVKDFCSLLKEKKLDLTWCCFARVDTVDYEMLKEMREAGCYQILYGIESASSEILENIKKRITLDRVEKAIKDTKKADIEVRLSFMIGNPGETEETIKKTIKYAIYLDPDLVSFNITTPYPGTEMFEWAKGKNILLHKDWTRYNFADPVMDLPTVSSSKIKEYYKKAHRQFYFRPKYILKRIRKIKSLDDFRRNFGPFISLLKFNIGK